MHEEINAFLNLVPCNMYNIYLAAWEQFLNLNEASIISSLDNKYTKII
jgi:hypothetical protein